jgi:hypothetical protein
MFNDAVSFDAAFVGCALYFEFWVDIYLLNVVDVVFPSNLSSFKHIGINLKLSTVLK